MRRVAFLSYYFPPIGGAGAQRPARFARYLREVGWEPVVITGPGPAADRWTPRDDALDADVPNEVEVRRLDRPEPPQSTGWAVRGERLLGRTSPWARWWRAGVVAAAEDLKGVDLVYAWMSPFESAQPAAQLARRFHVPWVADLGDPWALDEMMVYPTRWNRARELRRMRQDLSSATAVVMSTPEAVQRVRASIPELAATEVVAIPNGYDAADFERPATQREDGAFRIVHTGYLHTELGLQQRRRAWLRQLLGGTAPGVDFLTRSHVYLLRAVQRVLDEDPAAEGTLEVCLAGVVSEADRRQAEPYAFVRLPGYVPHDRTLELLRGADLLFLPMHELPPGARAGIVPGKTYEYLGSGRPILAAVPEGDARDLLAESGGAIICPPAGVDCMAEAIRDLVALRRSGGDPPQPRPDVVGRYEYRALARRLGEVFDRAAG
jgi:glycosyltransferase involved in cell wall biosynthesis